MNKNEFLLQKNEANKFNWLQQVAPQSIDCKMPEASY